MPPAQGTGTARAPGASPGTAAAAAEGTNGAKYRAHTRDADSQQTEFEFAEFAANSFAARIRCELGVKFRVLRIRGEFVLRIRRRQAPAAARALLGKEVISKT